MNFIEYCIRINPAGNYGHELRILLNDEEVGRIPANEGFSSEHVECYDKNDYPNEAPIYEIQPTGLDGVSITVTVDDEGSLTPLYFGENTDLDFIFMNVENPDVDIIGCPSSYGTGEATAEASSTLKIQNGVIIESECVWNPTLWTQDGNCFEDSEDRILDSAVHYGGNNGEVRHEFCLDFCSTRGYRFWGVQMGNYCFCGNDAPTADPRPDYECNVPCQGDIDQMCGGVWRMNVYAVTP